LALSIALAIAPPDDVVVAAAAAVVCMPLAFAEN
jgi:hypothetical protein